MTKTLLQEIAALAEEKEKIAATMTPDQLKAADAAFENMIEGVVELFIGEEEDKVDMEKLKSVSMAVTFFAELLVIMKDRTEAEIIHLFDEGF